MKLATSVVHSILKHIENNIDENLTVADIAAKAGYTERHLHTIFRKVVGMTPGKYIRTRRLRRAAIRVRLSSQSITHIALDAGFDSVQSFSREFSKLFGVNPRTYRQMEEWDLKGLLIPQDELRESPPKFTLCQRPSQVLYGYCVNYQKSLISLPIIQKSIRWQSIQTELQDIGRDIICAYEFLPCKQQDMMLNVQMFVGTTEQDNTKSEFTMKKVVSGGLYAQFEFNGNQDEYSKFAQKIYMAVLPQNNILRRAGEDIEHFHYGGNLNDSEKHTLSMTYYVPVTLQKVKNTA
ncbi:helix-turn-helix domain-containing protein [Citrobacter werkmanii]|uniref:Right origin-binding protein n=1 Tax=Citrobacter werkmanii TaxID=67827 RepID=A0A9N8CTA7_9ENTR|nr:MULTISPECIES: helix-turn-helix domain-containing protein [Citrobacter]MBQ4926479.1 helix-turn-helix domain-containing protein [Citrobacter werkmanii]MBQ4938839.1 helix-turn-helix domain-containing protein [Citrobacter werkmanii]MBQ4951621.1 helix-turn-helix domain-containing protein [Citrobacter werkmanii]MBQ4967570.1 helix-turn-helix domain-containing protein [Citrobacter werkmanii]MDM3294354.1 helix-turn-helix domain-containing protein [Citrobacter sp. Cc139]